MLRPVDDHHFRLAGGALFAVAFALAMALLFPGAHAAEPQPCSAAVMQE